MSRSSYLRLFLFVSLIGANLVLWGFQPAAARSLYDCRAEINMGPPITCTDVCSNFTCQDICCFRDKDCTGKICP